jgi:O-antigen/teichoic acid export membrane protein
VLPPAEFGLVELALSVTVFFVLGVESGMGMYGARLVAATPADLPAIAARIMLLRLLYGVPAYGVLLIVASRYGEAGALLAVYGLVVLLTPMFVQWAFQGLRQMQWVAAGTALRNFVFVGLVLALVRPDSDLRLVGLAEVGGAAALAVFNLVVLRWRVGVRLDLSGLWDGTRRLFRDVWYLGASDMTWACLWYAPGVIVGWMLLERTEQVAWIGAAVRIVLSLHTFVWLYFFNLLPNLTLELAQGLENWRELVQRSLRTSMWPAGLIAVAGTVVAPRLMPTIYGGAYEAAVVPFQIIIWMIPVTWLSGHFRYTLIASGHQRWEAAASAATAVVTVTAAVILVPRWESSGAAAALLIGGVANTGFAIALACCRSGATTSCFGGGRAGGGAERRSPPIPAAR